MAPLALPVARVAPPVTPPPRAEAAASRRHPPGAVANGVLVHWCRVAVVQWSLVIGHWSLVIGHWALGIGHWALGVGPAWRSSSCARRRPSC